MCYRVDPQDGFPVEDWDEYQAWLDGELEEEEIRLVNAELDEYSYLCQEFELGGK